MNLLLSFRGDLDQRMAVTIENGQEYVFFKGNLPLIFAVIKMSQWLVGYKGRDDLEPADNLIAVAIVKGKYFVPNQARFDLGDVATVCEGIDELDEEDKKFIAYAQTITLYNGDREGAGLKRPVAIIKRPPGGDHQLRYLNASLNEMAGVLHQLRSLHITIGEHSSLNEFFTQVPIKKLVIPEKPEKESGLWPPKKSPR